VTFDDNIFDREQGLSAECYVFIFSNGTSLYFTSYERDLLDSETPDGIAYTHIPIKRTENEDDDALSANRMTLTAQQLNSFANALISGGQISVSINKVFLADKTYQNIFSGLILSIEKSIGEATAQCASKMYYLEKELPRVFFQAPCNNTLFDSKCSLVQANFQYTVSVTVSQNGYLLTVNTSDYNGVVSDYPTKHTALFPDGTGMLKGLWTLGQVKNVATGEIRFITRHSAKTLNLHYPFTGITSGTISVLLTPGCDKTGLYCASVFGDPATGANILNFTGMPYMPATDSTVIAAGS
jgi:hypothetical protein